MDILKKMFKLESEQKDKNQTESSASNKDEFRKPQWFEEAETDDELFDDDRKFQVFTSPLEMQKHFERQFQRLMESLNDQQGSDGVALDRDLREDFLKPGFESKILKELEKSREREFSRDTDLDGEIFGDQLFSLIQRLDPEKTATGATSTDAGEAKILPSNQRGYRKLNSRLKLTDEETILGRIHGTLNADGEENTNSSSSASSANAKMEIVAPMMPMIPPNGMPPFGNVFDGNYQGPKLFSQSVISKTVRKPDGSYETTKITQDSSGNKTTTVTRMIDGKKETIVTHDGVGGGKITQGGVATTTTTTKEEKCSDRNVFVSKEGYAMPRNLW